MTKEQRTTTGDMEQATHCPPRTVHDRILGGIIGLVVGDALGVPAEFQSRAHLRRHPITAMTGYGSHNQPPGTWSDDSSLALCTLASLLEGYNPNDMMARFSRWWSEGYMAPHGAVFDIGITTSAAIQRFSMKRERNAWGSTSEGENGNGSLMRILPLSFYVSSQATEEIVTRSFEVSALTHAHIRSQLCCAYYSLLIKEVLAGSPLVDAMAAASRHLMPYVPEEERDVLRRILDGTVVHEPEGKIRGSGYVVHCLEASLWCAGHHSSFAEAVLAAVNLGEDTDTTAAVTAGLAGTLYGIAAIPQDWRDALVRGDEVMAMATAFADAICSMR